MSRATLPKRAVCPLCRKPADAQHAPFCSQGCRDRDLLNWLGDAYRMPGPPAEEEPEGVAVPPGDSREP